MDDLLRTVYAILITVGSVAIGGATLTGIAYGLFKLFGEKWLDTKFAERLAAYKHAQQKEIEELRFRINTLLDRTTKLHQREFEALPEAWSRLNDAYAYTTALVSSLQQYPDLDRMTNDQLNEFLEATSLAKWEKAELIAAGKKTDAYIKRITWHRLSDAMDKSREFHIYSQKNGIFIPEQLANQFEKLGNLIWNALIEYRFNLQHEPTPRIRTNTEEFIKQGDGLLKALRKEVQGRLWNFQSEKAD